MNDELLKKRTHEIKINDILLLRLLRKTLEENYILKENASTIKEMKENQFAKVFTDTRNQDPANNTHMYCPASQEWQWRHVLFTKLSWT